MAFAETKIQTSLDGAESQFAWAKHWSADRQQTLSQRFFSFYRKAVFARTVCYYVERHFPAEGLFVEAGSGTAETSMRIDKHNGSRKLIATDIVHGVLKQCHPVMDAKVCADIFNMPYANDSIDGIWNVGVMEHFTHEQIDRILAELYRVLKPGHRIILLWPGADSMPQKMLKFVELFINLGRSEKFSFHPPEISQLKSRRQGNEILERNGFRSIHIDYGLRSLFAFKTLVAVKDEG
jgi:ubiquinone/menaquinone biosynthesis C-methylase UbiE